MKNDLQKAIFLFSLFLLVFTNISLGADRYWIAAGPANFNASTTNWSTASGGAGGASIPVGTDRAIFDGNGLGNCTITANYTQTTGGFQINAAYTGTITVNPAINVVYGQADFIQSGGTFTCGTGTFNSSTLASDFILNGGTFNRAAGNSTSAAGSITINGGTYNGAGGTTTLTAGALTITAGTYNGGAGNVTITNGAFSQSGGIFNCPTGTITFSNSFTKTAGTFNHNNGTVLFSKNAVVAINSNATVVCNNLTFNGTSAATDYTFTDSDIFEVNGTLTFTGASRIRLNGARLHAKGNITTTNTYAAQNTHNNSTLLINGVGNQTFTGAHLTNLTGYLPSTQINKPSGDLIFANKICIEGNWTYNAGTLDYLTNPTSTVCFLYGKTFSGIAHNLGNVQFHAPAATTIDLNSVVVTVNGLLTLSGGAFQLRLNNSTIHSKGDILITHTFTTSNSSNAVILINGTANQTITGTVAVNQGRLPAVTINKPSGTLYLSQNVTIEGNYTYTAGTIDYSSFGNTVCFFGAGSTLNLSGTHSLGNVTFFGSAGNIYSLNGGMILTVDGTLLFAGANQFRLTGGSIHSKGNVSITNTYNASNLHTANLIINGIPDQTITSSVTAGRGRLPNITINKTTGNLLLAGNISTEGNWIFTDGTVDPQTSTVHFHEDKNIDGEGTSTMDFYNVTFADGVDKTLTGDVGVLNTLNLTSTWFRLNGNTMFIKNSATAAIINGGGGIISENTGNNSKISWDINSTTGAHAIPFINTFGDDVTFIFNLTSGNAGRVTVSTYPTAANNTPYPVTPQLVTNVDAFGPIDNSLNTVNRFWQIDPTGPNPTATLTFTYAEPEWDGGVEPNYNAQRYDDVTDIWQPMLPGQTASTVTNTVIVPSVTTFSPWTLATVDTPLDIAMINYSVNPNDKTVDVSWGVFSETNITGYEVQKTENFNDILTFESIESGNGIYEIKDEYPVNGVSYYRVVAKLINGNEEYFDWKKATFTNEENSIFNVYPNPINGGQTLFIETNSSENILIQIYDLAGKVIFTSQNNTQDDRIQITLPENISQGCYILSVNDKKSRLVIR